MIHSKNSKNSRSNFSPNVHSTESTVAHRLYGFAEHRTEELYCRGRPEDVLDLSGGYTSDSDIEYLDYRAEENGQEEPENRHGRL